jgi:guanosine-3',5'-bis(diphosphate) 3'-pyrophosphohydrolase
VSFTGGDDTEKATGEHPTTSTRVFRTVKQIVQDHAKKYKIPEFDFHAERSGPSGRLSLYQKASKKYGGGEQPNANRRFAAFNVKFPIDEDRKSALEFARKAHSGQTRSDKSPYIEHPIRVAGNIEQFKKSHNIDALISAAYLHDTMEDSDTTFEDLEKLFGGLVASLVKELTSDKNKIEVMGKTEYLIHKMKGMSSWALAIKLADRLDNVSDLKTAKNPAWRHKYRKETEEILNRIEKERILTGSHKNIISMIRKKLSELDENISEMKRPRWEVPAEPGSTPTPEGQIKLYHQTSRSAISPIRKQGIEPRQPVEGPRGIYAAPPNSKGEGFYGHPRHKSTIEFHVDKDEYRSPFVHRNLVEPEKIVAGHKPWHSTVRYIDNDPRVKAAVLSGEHDDLIAKGKSDDYAKAIRFVKRRERAKAQGQ